MSLWDWIYTTFGIDHLLVVFDLLKEFFASFKF